MSTIKIPSYYYLRRLHGLSLILPLGVYLLFAFLMAGLALGPDGFKSFNTAIRVFSHIPLLFLLEVLFFYLPLLFYFFYGLARLTERETHIFHPLSVANTLYFFHGVTLLLSFLFLAFHFYSTRILAYVNQSSLDYLWMVRLFENPYVILIYLVGIFSILFHYAYTLRGFLIDCGSWPHPTLKKVAPLLVALVYLVFVMAILNFVYHYNDPPSLVAILIRFVREILSR